MIIDIVLIVQLMVWLYWCYIQKYTVNDRRCRVGFTVSDLTVLLVVLCKFHVHAVHVSVRIYHSISKVKYISKAVSGKHSVHPVK